MIKGAKKRMKKTFFLIGFLVLILLTVFSAGTAAFSAEHADFSIVYDELEIPLQTFSIFVLPNEEIKISIAEKDKGQDYQIQLGNKKFTSDSSFTWNAHSESGHYPVKIKRKGAEGPASEINLNVFVLYPHDKKNGQYLEDFRIGNYPEIPADKKEMYSRPKGFLKIDESLLDINLTPHFKMEQFLTNQTEKIPQFIVIKESLLLKLELFLEEVNKAGYETDTFGIVSLYRSPYFNKEIGNNTHYSRHIYGDAADIYIDNKGDEWMDDLNGDGKTDIADADILFDLACDFDKKNEDLDLQGGVGSYDENGVRGPFIHIDTRGQHVRW